MPNISEISQKTVYNNGLKYDISFYFFCQLCFARSCGYVVRQWVPHFTADHFEVITSSRSGFRLARFETVVRPISFAEVQSGLESRRLAGRGIQSTAAAGHRINLRTGGHSKKKEVQTDIRTFGRS